MTKRNISFISTIRQPVKTLLLFALVTVIAFAWVARAAATPPA